MIKEIKEDDIAECVDVIRRSFYTVAEELGFTIDNAPRFTAFATTQDRLLYQYYENNDKIIGYYSLELQDNNQCELNNLCVLPQYRHKHCLNFMDKGSAAISLIPLSPMNCF